MSLCQCIIEAFVLFQLDTATYSRKTALEERRNLHLGNCKITFKLPQEGGNIYWTLTRGEEEDQGEEVAPQNASEKGVLTQDLHSSTTATCSGLDP
jgi:hypothetical protein